MSHPTEVQERRATAAKLSRDGRSLRQIAAELGVSKDTVRRDLAVPTPPTRKSAPEIRELIAKNVAATAATLDRLTAAVEDAAAARPGYNIVTDEVASTWVAQLRAAAARITNLADEFGACYPHTKKGKMES